jgi:hypothetical protein
MHELVGEEPDVVGLHRTGAQDIVGRISNGDG